MTPLGMALNSALLHLVWQGVVVAFVLWIALAALRRRSAGARYLVSCTALGILALAPVVTMFLVYPSPIDPSAAYQRPALSREISMAVFATPIAAPLDWLALARIWML